jgi:hypothetical protein
MAKASRAVWVGSCFGVMVMQGDVEGKSMKSMSCMWRREMVQRHGLLNCMDRRTGWPEEIYEIEEFGVWSQANAQWPFTKCSQLCGHADLHTSYCPLAVWQKICMVAKVRGLREYGNFVLFTQRQIQVTGYQDTCHVSMLHCQRCNNQCWILWTFPRLHHALMSLALGHYSQRLFRFLFPDWPWTIFKLSSCMSSIALTSLPL